MILCAGTSKRFGSNKILAPLGGRTVLSHVIERMQGQVSDMALNAFMTDSYEDYGLPVFPDRIPGGLGPLAGILTAMEWATGLGRAQVLTVSGDTPFLPVDMVIRLGNAPKNTIVISCTEGRRQGVCSLWPVDLAPKLREFFSKGADYRVNSFLKNYTVQDIDFRANKNINPFFNVNTVEDLAQAEKILNRL